MCLQLCLKWAIYTICLNYFGVSRSEGNHKVGLNRTCKNWRCWTTIAFPDKHAKKGDWHWWENDLRTAKAIHESRVGRTQENSHRSSVSIMVALGASLLQSRTAFMTRTWKWKHGKLFYSELDLSHTEQYITELWLSLNISSSITQWVWYEVLDWSISPRNYFPHKLGGNPILSIHHQFLGLVIR